MIVCFQRFKSHNIYFKEKLEDKVSFPTEGLNMSPHVVSQCLKERSDLIYDLYAVSNHFGSLSFGHYTAYAKNHATGVWYDFNDSSVSEVGPYGNVVTSAAYVLYYKRRDFFPDGNYDFESIKQAPKDQDLSNIVGYGGNV